MEDVLRCEDLSVAYAGGATPVRNLSFAVKPGECFALVGASGAGKSTIARALVGLHGGATRITGALRIDGRDMVGAGAADWRSMRGRKIGFVGQNPWTSCDPLRPVRDHVAEAWRCHDLAVSWTEIADRLDRMGVPDAQRRAAQHPHTWSGGMLQRASIAAAGALAPPILIADEPTSALDADRAQSVLDALKSLGSAIVLISHDIALVLRNADRVGVLHRGGLVETGTPDALRDAPGHPETRRLLASLAPMPPRTAPVDAPVLLRMTGVSVRYGRGSVAALDHADLEIAAGRIVGVQGPSGCGKSTLLRVVMGIEPPSRGTLWRSEVLSRPGAVLPVFQDPVGSLVPHWPIWRGVSEPLTAPGQARMSAAERRDRARAALERVGLGDVDCDARPAELSVGQCQRVSLARATITAPALIVADEPTSALDGPSTWRVSTLLRAAAERGTAVLVVSHDRDFLERLADVIVPMAAGRTVAPPRAADPAMP